MDARIRLQNLLIAFLLAGTGATVRAAMPLSETVQIKSFPTHGRLIFRIDDTVPTEVKDTSEGFEILFKGLGFTDIGAPLGQEQEWATEFKKTLQDPRIASIDFREVKGGLEVVGKWKYPTGANAPADPSMETFDYHDHSSNDGTQFVVDFWLRKGLSVADEATLKKKYAKIASLARTKADIARRAARRLASEKAKASLNDLAQFCKLPLGDDRDVFLPFQSVNEKVDYDKYLPQSTPDAHFTYSDPQGDSKDAQYVRLALKLYREGKYALVGRTLDFMDVECPDSVYHDEMRFLRANALIKLDQNDKAEQMLESIKADAKGKPVALYAALYLVGKQLNRKDPLGTYETFSWIFTYYPDHPLAWLFHLGAAEALAAIKQTEQAAKQYEWVAANAKLPWQKAQGALRLGNLYLDRREYAQALAAYSSGLRYFKKESEDFPSIHLNRGEALFSLGEYDEARKVFEDFVNKFSGYPEGWRATLRLGEIYGRLDGQANEKDSRHWFYATVNHYPLSLGSTLARLRLLPCDDHGGFTFDAAEHFFDTEASAFDGTGQVSMVHYPDLRTLAKARSYIAFGHDEEAAELIEDELPQVKSAAAKSALSRLYEELFRKNILTLLKQGKRFEALAYFDEHSKFRMPGAHGESVADPDFLLGLSLAASGLGLGKEAERLAQEYRKVSTGRVLATTATAQGSSDIDTRIKLGEQSFAEARALWVSGDRSSDQDRRSRSEKLTNQELIRKKLEQVPEESRFSLEKEVILGLLEQQLGKPKTALSHALKAQILAPSKPSQDADQLEAWLADLEIKAGDSKAALGMYADLEKRASADKAKAPGDNEISFLGVPPVPALGDILLAQGQILEGEKRWGESAAAYSRAMSAGLGGNQAVYGYAHALLQGGHPADREKALATLEKLAGSSTDDFWKKLGKDALDGERLSDSR